MSFNRYLEKTITKSQRCQRNWDLSKQIPTEDIKTMMTSVTQCSSKQNRVFYKCKFITNREIIEKIYKTTGGAGYYDNTAWKTLAEWGMTKEEALSNDMLQNKMKPEYWTTRIYDDQDASMNPQVLGNLLVAFIRDRDPSEGYRTREERMSGRHMATEKEHPFVSRDENVALGIGAGYLTLTSNMLGYASGCCQCHDEHKVSEILGETEPTLLLMGIGFPDTNRSRLEHHRADKRFPSRSKTIIVDEVN